MDILCILLFIGAMGKSAQLGLHTWLPDAMEGPTPVSALIHAATMVTAGVFMVCRLSPMFETAPTALAIVTVVGAATCFFAATIGTTQWDIKRVIAYSTCSQLGYMFFAAGVGAYGVAMFHLFTHAFFKALLFLGAGSVIHAMHHEQDMRYYGDLRKRIPITFWAMMAGTLAITGVGVLTIWRLRLCGVLVEGRHPRSGMGARNRHFARMAFWAGVIAALLTSFYSWRLMFLTFWGKPRWIESEHIQHSVHKTPEEAGADTTGGYHPHESPMGDVGPACSSDDWGLCLPGLCLQIPLYRRGQRCGERRVLGRVYLLQREPRSTALHAVPLWVKLIRANRGHDCRPCGRIHRLHRQARHSCEVRCHRSDGCTISSSANGISTSCMTAIFVKPAFWFGRQFWKLGDVGTIDRFGPNGIAAVVERGSVAAKTIQSGYLYTYALIMLLGLDRRYHLRAALRDL